MFEYVHLAKNPFELLRKIFFAICPSRISLGKMYMCSFDVLHASYLEK